MIMDTKPGVCPLPRPALACENCRSKRSRCTPSRQEGKCQRCYIGQLTCVYGIRKTPGPKPRDAEQLTPRQQSAVAVPPIEQSVQDDVVSSLLQAQRAQDDVDEEEGETVADLQNVHARVLDAMFRSSESSSTTLPTSSTPSTSSTRITNHARYGGPTPKLTARQAKAYLDEFMETRMMLFPFLHLTPTRPSLPQRPCLSLAILCVMTIDNPRVHFRLEKELRRIVGDVATGGHRSQRKALDILQGLMVYLAWYPLHLEPRNSRVHRLLKIAVELAVEIQGEYMGTGDEHLEYMQTLMGCFVLSASVSKVNEPQVLPVTSTMRAAAEDLLRHPSCGDDTTAWLLFNLEMINSEITKCSSIHAKQHLPQEHLLSQIQSFEQRIQFVNDQGTPAHLLNPSVVLLRLFVELNLACLRLVLQTHYGVHTFDFGTLPIIQCLQAMEASIGAFLSEDTAKYATYTTVNWARLIHTIIIAFKLLATVRTLPNVPPQTLSDIMRFNRYLELLQLRMQARSNASTPSSNDANATPDIFCLWASILQVTNEKYSELARETQAALNAEPHAEAFKVSATLCPMINGSLRGTEYWNAWSSSSSSNKNLVPDAEPAITLSDAMDSDLMATAFGTASDGNGWWSCAFPDDQSWATPILPSSNG